MNQSNQKKVQLLIKLYNSNKFNEVENIILDLINKRQNNLFLNNMLGLALARQNSRLASAELMRWMASIKQPLGNIFIYIYNNNYIKSNK